MKNYSKHISGLTLIEIMIGIVITTIMMAAVYTSYSVVNQSYSQVSEKAKISRASRDIVTMLMTDVRMAGFKYYDVYRRRYYCNRSSRFSVIFTKISIRIKS